MAIITNGEVTGNDHTRIEASESISYLFGFKQDDKKGLAVEVQKDLAKKCDGGKLKNITQDLS